MKLFRSGDAAFERADERNFVGSARVMKMPMVEDATQPVVVYLVEFEPGGRTNWHRHSGPQLLLVKEGRGFVQKWGERPRAIAAGDAITIEPNEKHWHGASAAEGLAHFAVNLNFTTEWLEPVADDQYRAS